MMDDIRANGTIDAQPSSEGDDISDQHVPLPSDQLDSTSSPTKSYTGSSNPFEGHSFTDDGYVSDGTMALLF